MILIVRREWCLRRGVKICTVRHIPGAYHTRAPPRSCQMSKVYEGRWACFINVSVLVHVIFALKRWMYVLVTSVPDTAVPDTWYLVTLRTALRVNVYTTPVLTDHVVLDTTDGKTCERQSRFKMNHTATNRSNTRARHAVLYFGPLSYTRTGTVQGSHIVRLSSINSSSIYRKER